MQESRVNLYLFMPGAKCLWNARSHAEIWVRRSVQGCGIGVKIGILRLHIPGKDRCGSAQWSQLWDKVYFSLWGMGMLILEQSLNIDSAALVSTPLLVCILLLSPNFVPSINTNCLGGKQRKSSEKLLSKLSRNGGGKKYIWKENILTFLRNNWNLFLQCRVPPQLLLWPSIRVWVRRRIMKMRWA